MEKISFDNHVFKTKKAFGEYVKTIISEKPMNIELDDPFLSDLIKRHPDYDEKIQDFRAFLIQLDTLSRSRKLSIVKTNGFLEPISINTCITGNGKSDMVIFKQALRNCINPQIQAFKNQCRDFNCCMCDVRCDNNYHVDHYEPQFNELVKRFIAEYNPAIPSKYGRGISGINIFKEESKELANSFNEYHAKYAQLRILCVKCNLTRSKTDI